MVWAPVTAALCCASPGLGLTAAGFLRRADQRWHATGVQFSNDVPHRWFRSRNLNLNQFSVWNVDGDRLVTAANVNAGSPSST